jgi:hypothetical protein
MAEAEDIRTSARRYNARMRDDSSTSLRASHIRETLERNTKAVSLRASLGVGAGAAT